MRTERQMRNRTLVSAYIEEADRDRLVPLARDEDRSVSAVVRGALRAELARSDERRSPGKTSSRSTEAKPPS